MPVHNTMHFLMPVSLENWNTYDVPGIIGVVKKESDGSFTVIDAFDVDSMPSATELAMDARFGQWTEAAGTRDNVYFDVFLTPKQDQLFRHGVVTLLERSCGFHANQSAAYAHAV